MSKNVFVRIDDAQVGNDLGFDVTVSDDDAESDTVFVGQTQLDAVGGVKIGRCAEEPGRRDAVALVAWMMRNDGQAADILQAAMDNDHQIDTDWDSLEPSLLKDRLISWDAEEQRAAMDARTAPAVGNARSPRI